MPGFGLVFDTKSRGATTPDRFRSGLDAMRHDDRYRSCVLSVDHPTLIGWTVYDGYPIRAWESRQFRVVVEGMIYDRTWDQFLAQVEAVENERDPWERAGRIISDCAAAADGDFAIILSTKVPPHGIIVALDPLGRLPVYWSQEEGRLIVGREVKFLVALRSTVQPDRTGIAQMLAMGFPWEDRTLVSGVRRLPPGAVLSWREDETDPRIMSAEPSFVTGPVERRMADCAGELVEQFLTATRRRVDTCSNRPLVLSLSGGMDSRGVAAAFYRLDVDAVARTFSFPGYQSPREAESAREIAGLSRLDWRSVPVSAPSPESYDRLVHLKDGLNSAAMAYADQYLTVLVGEAGPNAVLFSGGGGDLALVPRHPERRLRSTDELADLLLFRNLVFHPRLLIDAMGIGRRELQTELAGWLDSYPESDMADKYLHFCFAGYEYKSYFEGEDRNRSYLWTAAPFYSPRFFERAMRVPFEWKRRRRLAGEFLRQFNPEVGRVRNANTGLVPGSVRDSARQWGRQFALSRGSWEKAARKWRRRHTAGWPFPPVPRTQLVERITASPSVGEVFRRDRLLDWVENPAHAAQVWPLYTIVRYLRSLD
ncbi:MAG: asparagine synthase-related protein [Candidatus Zixiibacteriota bacterium]